MTARVHLIETDFEVLHAGSFFVLCPRNDAAGDWLYQHLPQAEIQWWGGGVAIEPRDLPDIVENLEADGFDVRAL
jgi:hypothetical protein